ncbi:PaaI family thioesterase [Janibacter sp. RAF20_2_2]|uniref:PaaI family thioesterase n=1 Tax=unclassified Janibacter TaxID=2649294 RepID=UPI003F914BAC
MSTAFQDTYPGDVAHCYGCGTQNPAGHQLKSHWDGEETVARFTPRPEHTAMPGYVYGGLIASLVDCQGTGSAAAAGHRAQGREMGTEPTLRYVTASLHVDYLAPTPMGVELELRGVIEEVTERKVVVAETVHAGETLVVKGKVVAVLMPAGMARG